MKNRFVGSILGVAAMLAFACVVLAQTAAQRGTQAVQPAPRTPDGKPDVSGVWGVPDRGGPDVDRLAREESRVMEQRYGRLENPRPSRTPAAEMRYQYNRDPRPGYSDREELNPAHHCVPYGPAYLITGTSGENVGGYEIIQSPRRVLIIYELDHNIRQIWMDGRGHPPDLEHTWMGDSIGRWDGDTLIVDTVGLRNEPWLDGGGNVHSKQLRMEERYRRLDHNTMLVELTLTDPLAFTRPWTRRMYRALRNWDLAEDVRCYADSPELRNQKEVFQLQMMLGE